MEISLPNAIIKNSEYLAALNEFQVCMKANFDKLKFSKNFDQDIHHYNNKNNCKVQIEEFKKIINEGGLDYDNFKN